MKNKIVTVLILALTLGFASSSFAAEGKKRGKGGAVIAKLGLDADQKKAFAAANKEAGEARKKLADITDKKERRAKVQEIQKNLQAKLDKILNDEQKAKLKELRAEQAKARKAKGGERKKKKDTE